MAFEGLKEWLRRKGPPPAAGTVYDACVDAARAPGLYADIGVPDTEEGRFEMVALHVFLVVRHLRQAGARDPLGQAVFDRMARDLDDTYRERGFGDKKVARLVRGHAEAFYGRVLAYEAALSPDASPTALPEALARNVYADETRDAGALADYTRRADAALDPDTLRAGHAAFPAPMETPR